MLCGGTDEVLGILFFAGVGALTAASRCTYAFARYDTSESPGEDGMAGALTGGQ